MSAAAVAGIVGLTLLASAAVLWAISAVAWRQDDGPAILPGEVTFQDADVRRRPR